MILRTLRFKGLIGWLLLSALGAYAQWETQEIPLQAGWQAVHLQVAPAVDQCPALFSGTEVESVHWWRAETTREEFDLDPDVLFPRRANWEVWYADDPDMSTFSRLLAGECYLIKVRDGAASWDEGIPGRVLLNPRQWIPGMLNLAGVPAATNTSLGQFFYFTDLFTVNSSTSTVFRVGTNGQPERVFLPWSTLVRSGEAYWIQAGAEARQYEGPVRVWMDSGVRLLDFGKSLLPRMVNIQNNTDVARLVRIAHRPSEEPPVGSGRPALLGRPALRYEVDAITGTYDALPDVLVTNLSAGEILRLKLMPDVAGMTSEVDAGSAWQGILEITDGGNVDYTEATVRHRLGMVCDGDIGSQANRAGLWVGEVVVDHVSRAPARLGAESAWDSTTPLPVAEPFRFRLIIHVDSTGQARLLQRVITVWCPDGEVVTTPSGVYTNGAVELLSDDALIPAYLLAHPSATINRLSTVNLPLLGPWQMSGSFGSGQTLTALVELPFDDAVNPFVHRYHPQHDNLEYLNDVPYALEEGDESYTVTRDMQFTFLAADPDGEESNLLWGTEEMGGSFEEHVDGLNKTLYVAGSFRLRRVSDTAALIEE